MTWAVPLPPETGDEEADVKAFLAWEEAVERHYNPERFGQDGKRLPEPRKFTFYVGTPDPSWLRRCDGVPKFVSVNRLDKYKSEGERWPVFTWDPYAIDSGAYIALDGANTSTPWWLDRETYASKVFTYATNNGGGQLMPDFCAPQDWPCEPNVRKRTGLTVREHQRLTLESYLWLREEWPQLPWIPVLQGWEANDYRVHQRMYQDAGVDLADCHRVGVGSICRRGHLPQIVDVIEQFAESGYQLHGFGIKKTALPIIGHLLRSADSMAWSYGARYTPVRLDGCTHTNCANCYRYAKQWREEVLASMEPTEEEAVPATTTITKDGRHMPAGTVLPLHEVPWGTYGEVSGKSFGFYSDVTHRGYLTTPPRIYTGGSLGKPQYKGVPFLGVRLAESFGRESDGTLHAAQLHTMYVPLDATFTVLAPPPGRPIAQPIEGWRRLPVADLRKGDVVAAGELNQSKRAGKLRVLADPELLGEDLARVLIQVGKNERRVVAEAYEPVDVDQPARYVPGNVLTPAPAEPKPRKEPAVTAATTDRKIRFNSYKGADAVSGADVNSRETIRCPVSGCDRQAKTRHDGTVGMHKMYGKQTCHLYGKRIPAEVMVDVLSRRTAAAATSSVDDLAAMTDMDTVLASMMADAAALTPDPAAERAANADCIHLYDPKGDPADRCPYCGGHADNSAAAEQVKARIRKAAVNTGPDLEYLLGQIKGRPGHVGYDNAVAVAERYATGRPLARYERQLSRMWTLVCPVPSCQTMRDGWATVRGLHAGWMTHAAEHDGFVPAGLDDDADPVVPGVAYVVPPAGKPSGSPATVEIVEPKDDPWWAELRPRLMVSGRVTEKRGALWVRFDEGTREATKLKKALLDSGVPVSSLGMHVNHTPKPPSPAMMAGLTEMLAEIDAKSAPATGGDTARPVVEIEANVAGRANRTAELWGDMDDDGTTVKVVYLPDRRPAHVAKKRVITINTASAEPAGAGDLAAILAEISAPPDAAAETPAQDGTVFEPGTIWQVKAGAKKRGAKAWYCIVDTKPTSSGMVMVQELPARMHTDVKVTNLQPVPAAKRDELAAERAKVVAEKDRQRAEANNLWSRLFGEQEDRVARLRAKLIPVEPSVRRHQVRREADEILANYATESRERLAWAAGVATVAYTSPLVSFWGGQSAKDAFAPEFSGGSMPGHLFRESTKQGFFVYGYAEHRTDRGKVPLTSLPKHVLDGPGEARVQHLKVTWESIGKLVTEARVPAHLVQKVKDACAARGRALRAKEAFWKPGASMSWDTKPVEQWEAEARITVADELGEIATAELWAAIKPAGKTKPAKPEPFDLDAWVAATTPAAHDAGQLFDLDAFVAEMQGMTAEPAADEFDLDAFVGAMQDKALRPV